MSYYGRMLGVIVLLKKKIVYLLPGFLAEEITAIITLIRLDTSHKHMMFNVPVLVPCCDAPDPFYLVLIFQSKPYEKRSNLGFFSPGELWSL